MDSIAFWPAVLTLWLAVEVVWLARKSCQRQERRRGLRLIEDRLDWLENQHERWN